MWCPGDVVIAMDIVDGDGSAVGDMVKKSSKDDYGLGTQNLVRHLACKYLKPKIEHHTHYFGERGLYASTKYIFVYLPEDAIDEKIVSVEKDTMAQVKIALPRSRESLRLTN